MAEFKKAVFKVGDIVRFNGKPRRVLAVAKDGVTVTVSAKDERPSGLAGLAWDADVKTVPIVPNRAARRAEAARQRRAKGKA